jgi:GTP-binding protein EngB required for normal cell division
LTETNKKFNAAAIATQFKTNLVKFDDLLAKGNHPELTAIRKKLGEELKTYRELGVIGVAFVGQYSAGKSTIISALTGRRDIHIDADIATDKTTSYDWNGIKLIDTPGLFTDRTDHDEITYNAINNADLLVFCLTYMLFDSLTAENFKKLAYEKSYRWKMMLVINKMADGAGEEEELIANYSKSLAAAIEPYNLDEFPLCFIDAKDYCEGVDEKDEFLIEVSRFQSFTDALNTFVKRRGSLTKFDTPVRIALSYVDDAQLSLTRDSNEDSAFFELLNRLSRTIRQERDRLRTKIRGIALRLSAAAANEGTILARAVGGNEDIEPLGKQAESNVQKHCDKAGSEIEEAVKAAVESLQEEIKEVLQSDLAQAFVARLEVNQKVYTHNVDSGVDVERLRGQVKLLKDIGERAGVKLTNLATKTGANTTGQAFLRASNVAGGGLHQGVYAMGKFLGFNFKPWQAVNIAKGIGNVAKILGPVLSVGLLAVDIYAVTQEEQLDQKLVDARREITSQFTAIGKEIESQIEAQIIEVESQIFGEFQNQIAEARKQEEEAIGVSNKSIAYLAEIRKEFEKILSEINKYGDNV